MKIKFVNLYTLIIYFIFILQLGWLNYFFYGKRVYIITSILSIIAFFVYVLQPIKHSICNKAILYYIYLIIIYWSINFIRVLLDNKYNISLVDAINNYGSIFVILLCFPLYEIYINNFQKFMWNIYLLWFITYISRIIIWFLYNFKGINIAPNLVNETWVRSLNNTAFTRVGMGLLWGFAVIYTCMLINQNINIKKRIFGVINLIGIYIYTYFISQSRTQFFISIISILIILVFKIWNSPNKLLRSISYGGVIFILYLVFHDVILNLANTFAVNSEYGDSTLARIGEYGYFSSLWQHSSYLFGFGFAPDLFETIGGNYYISDVGIVIGLYQFGVIGIILEILPFLFAIVFIWNKRKYIKLQNSFLFIGLTVLFLVGLAGTNNYLPSVILVLPLYIAMLMYENYKFYNMEE